MKWFEGTIPIAIQTAKQKRSIFVVYISGQDDISKQMDATWDDESIMQVFQHEQIIAIKLQANSETCVQFSMIYPVVCVPSTFFIGVNGVPLEVTGGHVEPREFREKISNVIQIHKDQVVGQSANPASPVTSEAPSSSASAASPAEAAAAGDKRDEEPKAGPSSGDSTSPTAEKRKDKSEDVQRAEELRLQVRREKEEKEKEKERQKEVERRQLGQDMQKLKHLQKEQQQKEMMQEWKKEREEKKKEKERIKEMMARDRAEKAERFSKEKAERAKATEEAKRAKTDVEEAARARDEQSKRETARLQFRLPEGSTITHQFPSSATLEEARAFLVQNVGNKYGDFVMSSTWPKRDFQGDDYSKSLLDLELAPSAAIIVVPGSRLSVAPRGGGGGGDGWFWMLLAPLLALWKFICSLLFSAPERPRGAYNENTTPVAPTAGQPSPSTESELRHRQGPASSRGLRSEQQGNVRRFTADDDSDDMANWNGNSTQQM